MPKKKARTRRSFGQLEQLRSGRWRARYTAPTLERITAPHTFAEKIDAEGWLAEQRRLIDLGTWLPPEEREKKRKAEALTVRELCDQWLASGYLKESTVASHRRKLNNRVFCTSLANEPVVKVDRARVAEWWVEVQEKWPDTGNTNAAAYKRLHTAFQFAKDTLDIIDANPVQIKGAGKAPRPKSRDRPLITLSEAGALVDGVADNLRAPVMLLLWAGLRLGELLELRRKDLRGLKGSELVTVQVRRSAQRMEHPETHRQVMVPFDTPKTDAGNRDVVLPRTVSEALRFHCREFVADDAEALIVTTRTGAQMLDTSFRSRFARAKEAAGRPDISPHDCRRFYGTQLVTEGRVSLEEARRLMGHETVEQLLDYQRAAAGYEKRAAVALDALVPPIDEN
ncbi:tyrosine recombinase XerC [Corynebacterium sp. HMSC08A12]|uniref:site-specific integrase n=1 Tax=Corynebacterium sp. HMSC08A12 TaxID=1581134 RepID=UPI0009F22476|nr:site-specific integrase [Corynebacterium sp. HMSC08A12]